MFAKKKKPEEPEIENKKSKVTEFDDKKEYKITITEAVRGFKKGQEKIVSGNLARLFIKQGIAKLS